MLSLATPCKSHLMHISYKKGRKSIKNLDSYEWYHYFQENYLWTTISSRSSFLRSGRYSTYIYSILELKKNIEKPIETESNALIISVLRIVSWTVKGLKLASSCNLNQKYEKIQEIWIYKKEGNKHLKNRGYATIDLCISLPRLFYAMHFHK